VSVLSPSAKRAASAALFCLLAALAAHAETPKVVVVPEVKAGDRWVYRRMDYSGRRTPEHYRLVVTFAGRDAIQAVMSGWGAPESDVTYTSEWNDVVSHRGVVNLREKGELQFPLHVGATYRIAWELENPRVNRLSGRHERTVRVAGWESVTVPAGTFEALKVVSEGTHRPFLTYSITAPGTVLDTYWYVPAVKRWVKFTHESSTPVPGGRGVHEREHSGEELVEFEVQ
jgi:hypothetical protein